MADQKPISSGLKLTLELGPLILFFVLYGRIKDDVFLIYGTEYKGFIIATAVFIPIMLLATLFMWWRTGKLSRMQVMTAILVILFGGLGIWFNNESFFKMKPTVLYAGFAAALGYGLMRGESYLAYVMGEVMPMRPEGWMILTRRMALFFVGLAVANEVIWRTMSTDIWVNFKVFGLTLAMFVFLMAQYRVFATYSEDQG